MKKLILLCLSFILIFQQAAFAIASPPPSTIRTPAEYEPVDGAIITWNFSASSSFKNVLIQLATEIAEAANVYIVSSSTSQDTDINNSLVVSGKVPADRLKILRSTHNSIWQRDYGPTGLITESGDIAFTNSIYRRWSNRSSDDNVPINIGTVLGKNVYDLPIIVDNGNFMSDGDGTIFTTRRSYEWNNGQTVTNGTSTITYALPAGVTTKSEQEVRDIFLSYYNGTKIHVYDYLNNPFDGTGHLDMFSKLIAPGKILITELPSTAGNYTMLENTANYFKSATNANGEPYEVIRIPADHDESKRVLYTYTNSIIVNNKVIVPIYNRTKDAAALQVYRDHMPGYEVVGIDASSLIVQNGAIHCITQTVPKQAFTLDKVTLTGSNQSDVTVFNANNAQLAKVTTSTPSYLTEFNSTKDGYKKFTLKKEKHLTQKTEGFKMNSKVYLYQNNVQFTGGDANNDDEVNFDDFTSLLTEYNLSSSTKNADFNGDGITNFTDFVILLNGYGKKGSTK